MRPKKVSVSQSVKTRVVVAVATNHVAAHCVSDCVSLAFPSPSFLLCAVFQKPVEFVFLG